MDILLRRTPAYLPVFTEVAAYAPDQKASRAPPPPPPAARLRLIFGLASVPTRDTRPPLDPVERSRVGLCADCQHARRIVSAKGSSFWLCERSVNEPTRFAKYPPLPVLRCSGFRAQS
jgi:hypothetical protein